MGRISFLILLTLSCLSGACQKKVPLPAGSKLKVGPVENRAPVVDAGENQTIGTNNTDLLASAYDPDGTITGYAWTQQAGPNSATIVTPAVANTDVSGLIDGMYVFRCTATDNLGLTGYDDVTVLVSTVVTTDTAYIIINLGQSNATGRNAVSTNYVGSWAYLADTIKKDGFYGYIRGYLSDSAEFAPLKAAHNAADGYDRNQAGFQPKLMYDMVDYKNRDIYLIQSAQGGKKLTNWDTDGQPLAVWTDTAITDVKADFLAAGIYPKFLACVFIQGESDGGNFATSWANGVKRVAADVRTYTGNGALPFIVVEMIDCQTGVTNLAALQAAQEGLASEPNFYLIGKSGAGGCQDNLHFNFERQRYVADQIFAIIKDL